MGEKKNFIERERVKKRIDDNVGKGSGRDCEEAKDAAVFEMLLRKYS